MAGNYAADLLPNMANKRTGFPITLYLDSRTNSLVEEFSTSNFFGVKHDRGGKSSPVEGATFVTPKSGAVLPSITNKSLMRLAASLGMKVTATQVTRMYTAGNPSRCRRSTARTPQGSASGAAV